jgi:hypothetical protein
MFIQYGLCFLILLNLILLIFLFQRINQVRQQNSELRELLQKHLDDLDADLSDEDIVPLITDEQLSTLLRATIKRAIELHPKQKQEDQSPNENSTESKEEDQSKKDTDAT